MSMETINLETLDLDKLNISDYVRQLLTFLLNLIESTMSRIRQLEEERQELRDEINRLKGEQGQPKIKPNQKKSDTDPTAQRDQNSDSDSKGDQDIQQELEIEKEADLETNYSSEKEREEPKEHKKESKKERIKIDRVETLEIEPEFLPEDAEFKGYAEVVIQDIKIITDNVLFRKAKYYSPSTGRTYLAELPPGYQGQFGPGIRALVLILYFQCNMTQPKILELLSNLGCYLSAGQLSNLLIKNHEQFHAEKEAVYEAGLNSSPWQHIDDTAQRVNGQNQHTVVVCNPLYTLYMTTERKDRLTVIDVLRHSSERLFRVNDEMLKLLEEWRLPSKKRQQISLLPHDRDYPYEEFLELLAQQVPNLGPQQRKKVLDAGAIAAYHAQTDWPVVELLVSDDAGQFKKVTKEQALCWVHDGRHYNKLRPVVGYNRKLLDNFREQYWQFYRQLLAFRLNPREEEKVRLESEFDELFSTETGYDALDDRISKTKAKKESLLAVLDHPEIPLHNNPAELAARFRVRKRKISSQTRTEEGTKAWDTFMSLAATTKKLGLSFFFYVYARILGNLSIPPLPDLISEEAEKLNLGESFQPP